MKSILLIGLGRFGHHVALKLNELGHQVMAVDRSEERIDSIMPYVSSGQIGDSTNQEFLAALGINNYDVCIVAIGGDFQSSLETTALLKELGAQKIVARASRDVHAKFLKMAGADEIVYPEKQLANWPAIRYSSDHIFDYIELEDGYAIFEVEVPEKWIGQTIPALDIRKHYHINVIALRRNGDMNMDIATCGALAADDTLFVIGRMPEIKKCFHT